MGLLYTKLKNNSGADPKRQIIKSRTSENIQICSSTNAKHTHDDNSLQGEISITSKKDTKPPILTGIYSGALGSGPMYQASGIPNNTSMVVENRSYFNS